MALGEYPAHTLSQARMWREQCRALLAHGRSPAAAKQAEKGVQAGRATDTVTAFANLWYADAVTRTNREPRNIRCVLDKAEWLIPAERMKKDKPSRNAWKESIAHSTLIQAIRSLELGVRDFVIHDFRRTASTQLHEAGFNSDWIEKALAHEQKGVRDVYNKAEYLTQRREMLQWWADLVDAQIEEGRKVVIGRFGKAFRAA